MRERGVTLDRIVRAPRRVVWGLLGDTNRWDRAAGLRPNDYTWTQDADGTRQRIGRGQELSFELRWVEPPYEWLEGHWVRGHREFLQGPIEKAGFRAALFDANDGRATRAVATAYTAGSGLLSAPIGTIMKTKFRRQLTAFFDAIEQAVSELPEDVAPRTSMALARSLLHTHSDALLSGASSPVDHAVLQERITALQRGSIDPALAGRIEAMLRTRPDEEVAQIRPYELADTWRVPRRDVLAAFLHATRAGLTDLQWQINCPVCCVATDFVDTLQQLGRAVHCDACGVRYDIDFAEHVEAVFKCNAAIRDVRVGYYCASSPVFQPQIFAQVGVRAGASSLPIELPDGAVRVRTLGRVVSAMLPTTAHDDLRIHIEGDQLSVRTTPSEHTPTLHVETDRNAVLVLERAEPDGQAALGRDVMTLPDFLALFATDAPAAGVELSIGRVALLFSDLTGSTALYERIGDARAFAVVQEHFAAMDRIVTEHSGAVVKTMGDAVMATFADEADAVRAAMAMARATRDTHGKLGVGVKLGVHAGPCLVVRANDRIDFFGTTVNIAARLQGRARTGQLVLAREVADGERLAPLLASHQHVAFSAELKGIAGEQALLAFDVLGTAEMRRSGPPA